MFGMPCLKRENGKVVAGHWKDGGLTVKLTDTAQREAALAAGAQPFDPGMGRVMKEWVLVPESHLRRVAAPRRAGDLSGRADRCRVPARAILVKADRPELSLLEITFEPGSGVDPHFHKGHSDSFYVLEGEVEFHVGDEVVHATPGAYVLAPPNVVHCFRNMSDEPARMLNLHTPGGFAAVPPRARDAPCAGHRARRAFFERHDIFDV